jgi:hypothetical protein
VTAVIWVELGTVTEEADTPPKVTVAPAWKFEPVMVTGVPPAGAPEFGATADRVGPLLEIVMLRLALTE